MYLGDRLSRQRAADSALSLEFWDVFGRMHHSGIDRATRRSCPVFALAGICAGIARGRYVEKSAVKPLAPLSLFGRGDCKGFCILTFRFLEKFLPNRFRSPLAPSLALPLDFSSYITSGNR